MLTFLTELKRQWRFALVFVAMTGAFAAFLYVKGLRADNARLRQENQIHELAVASLTEELAANRKALATRDSDVKALAAERQAAVAGLDNLYVNDKESCDWSKGEIPDAGYQRLCGDRK